MKIFKNKKEQLRLLCTQHKVDRMYAFGSVVDDKLAADSDVDLLVKFKKFDLSLYFENYLALKENLTKLLERDIDLVEEQTLRNPILIRSINRNKALIYG